MTNYEAAVIEAWRLSPVPSLVWELHGGELHLAAVNEACAATAVQRDKSAPNIGDMVGSSFVDVWVAAGSSEEEARAIELMYRATLKHHQPAVLNRVKFTDAPGSPEFQIVAYRARNTTVGAIYEST